MTRGAEAWFFICENLCAAASDTGAYIYSTSTSLAFAQPDGDLDVEMADLPILPFPSSGSKKRSRDEEDDGDVAVEWGLRFEKVSLFRLLRYSTLNH